MLPQLKRDTFLTDGGLETELIFNQGIDLPEFAAFDLLKDEEGTATLRAYYEPYIALAHDSGMGFIYEAPTWRASPRWAERLGYSLADLEEANRAAVELGKELRDSAGIGVPFVISGAVGPQDDGYAPETMLTADEARDYHSVQIGVFAEAGADMVNAMTMTYAEEARGVVMAAESAGIPAAISFTVETDGCLPNGMSLEGAIAEVERETDGGASYFSVNCAHPTHFDSVAAGLGGAVRDRIRGLRVNASTRSHEELDEATELDDGDPHDLGARYVSLRGVLPNLTVLGGCCGTDLRHVEAIRDAWAASS